MLKSKELPSSTDNHIRQGVRLLISSRDSQALNALQDVCQQVPGMQVTARLVSNGHCDPLHSLEQMPDLLLLRVSAMWREELAALMQRPPAERPALLVCGTLDQAEGLRLAMQAGARDFLPEPLSSEELTAALLRMVQEKRASSGGHGKLLAVMNAKGGSGATLVACNLAQQLSQHASVLLIDLDLQFGSVAHYLDVQPSHSHVEVLQQVGEMDSLALRGFCTHYDANLHVLGGRSSELCLPQDIHAEQLEALLHLARSTYDWVVVDLPRQIDHLTGTTLENADKVLVVLQQSISHLKDADRLLHILRDEPFKNAVNLPSIPAELQQKVQPYFSLCEKLGLFAAQLSEGVVNEISITYSGELSGINPAPLTRYIVLGVMSYFMGEEVNYVNAPYLAEKREIHVLEQKSSLNRGFTNLITVNIKTQHGEYTASGTLLNGYGARIVKINRYPVDLEPQGHLLLISHVDRPGMVGQVGSVLGRNEINIASMQVGRQDVGGKAIMLLSIDKEAPATVLDQLQDIQDIDSVREIDL